MNPKAAFCNFVAHALRGRSVPRLRKSTAA